MIKLEKVFRYYGSGEAVVKALDGINLNVKEGEMIAIIGKSGSGKSTLLNILGGLDNVTKGTYLFNNKVVPLFDQKKLAKFRKDNIGFIVQYFALIEDMNVLENIALPLKYSNKTHQEIKKVTENILEKLGIKDKMYKYPNELSGGQKQRVAIARAIINNPKLILADEPTGALDEETEKTIMEIFKNLNKQGKTIIIVTHDSKIANQCNRIIRLSDGKIV